MPKGRSQRGDSSFNCGLSLLTRFCFGGLAEFPCLLKSSSCLGAGSKIEFRSTKMSLKKDCFLRRCLICMAKDKQLLLQYDLATTESIERYAGIEGVGVCRLSSGRPSCGDGSLTHQYSSGLYLSFLLCCSSCDNHYHLSPVCWPQYAVLQSPSW